MYYYNKFSLTEEMASGGKAISRHIGENLDIASNLSIKRLKVFAEKRSPSYDDDALNWINKV